MPALKSFFALSFFIFAFSTFADAQQISPRVRKLLELGADAKGEQGTLALKYARENFKNDWKNRAARVVETLESAGAK